MARGKKTEAVILVKGLFFYIWTSVAQTWMTLTSLISQSMF
jgi:hypothetical protein